MTGHEPRHPVLEATALSTVEQPLSFIDQVTGFATVDTALQQVIVPPHMPRIGQGGGILLLRYSMICVIGLAIFRLLICLLILQCHLPTYPPNYLPIYLPTHQATYPPTYLSINPTTYIPTNLPIHQLDFQSTQLPTYLPTNLPTYGPMLET